MKSKRPLRERDVYEKSTCVYFQASNKVSPEFWGRILSKIRKQDLHSNGKEFEPHVTLFYSKEETKKLTLKELFSFFKDVLPFQLELLGVDIFENEEFDVLFLKVKKSSDLLEVKEDSLEFFEASESFREYTPHMTLAYLKPGKGRDYRDNLNSLIQFPIVLKVDTLVYSVSTGETTYKHSFTLNE